MDQSENKPSQTNIVILDIPNPIGEVSFLEFIKDSTKATNKWYQNYHTMCLLRSLLAAISIAERKGKTLLLREDVAKLLSFTVEFPDKGYNPNAFKFLPFMDEIVGKTK